jgi:hypothetical protein
MGEWWDRVLPYLPAEIWPSTDIKNHAPARCCINNNFDVTLRFPANLKSKLVLMKTKTG